ncbi:deoxynucleoside kinase-like [Anoplophora glabripennis]|uniref:deoxynucleoside kinase-like n=1 Tax=Anoplophora glabripennis TaxID=217634 RepID=UPI0008757DB5|nr:deoxynucleoside kinase-like [Anoplophora glabripennis]
MNSVKKLITKMANSLAGVKSDLSRPFTVIVEGNVGSGKTTFLNYFNKYDHVAVCSEPIEMWRNCDGYNLLDLMYKDPKKWSFTFQSYVQLTMLRQHTRKIPQPIKLMERSIYSARYCFVEKMARDSLMAAPAVAVIDEWFKFITNEEQIDVDLIVYLRTSPEVVYERILKRNRSEERTIAFDYFKALHEIHEDWLYHKTLHKVPAPVIVLNANLDRSVIEEEYDKYEPQILNKLPLQAHAF